MNEEKEKIISKIKKCLAMSKSSNENEAIVALKQAQLMMKKYDITNFDVVLSNFRDFEVRTINKIPHWQWKLVYLCGDVFGCEYYKHRKYCFIRGEYINNMVFVGNEMRVELCGYAYEVLLRQLKKLDESI